MSKLCKPVPEGHPDHCALCKKRWDEAREAEEAYERDNRTQKAEDQRD